MSDLDVVLNAVKAAQAELAAYAEGDRQAYPEATLRKIGALLDNRRLLVAIRAVERRGRFHVIQNPKLPLTITRS